MRRPFVWFLVSLIAGIFCARYTDMVTAAAVILVITASAVIFMYKRNTKEFLFLPPIAVIGFMICISALKGLPADILVNEYVMAEGTVREVYTNENGRISVNLEAEYITDGKTEITDDMRISLSVFGGDFEPGDIIRAEGKLYTFDKPTNPYQTDYEIYMKSKGFDYSLWCQNAEVTGKDKGIIYSIEKARAEVNGFFDKNLPEKEAGIVKALTTGYKYDIDETTETLYRNMGISHVLAVSGLHVSVISALVLYILVERLKIRKRIAVITTAVFLLGYLIFTGCSPSAIRAVIMAITAFTALVLYRNSDSFNTISFSAFIMLLINPLYLWNVSFQLSYMGITGCAFALSIIKPMRKREKTVKTAIFAVVVWVFTTPLVIYYFGGVSILSVISNIFVVPYMSFVTAVSLVSGFLSFTPFGAYFLRIAYILLKLFGVLTDKIPMNMFYLNCTRPSVISLVVMYAFIGCCLVYREKDRKLKLISCGFGFYVLVLFVSGVIAPAEVIFFDCGQGDSSVIYYPDEATIVIDGGPEGEAKGAVIPYLKAKGVKADILFITHTDADHAGGALDIINEGLAEMIVVSDTYHEGMAEEIYNTAKENDVEIFRALQGDEFVCGKVKIKCLYPMTDRFEEENNNSLVLKTEINGTEFLFTGDIEAEDEKYLMNSDIECDIIKIPHHGSKTSSTEAFIEAVNADIAVIEAAEDNIYGFPHEEVVERLKENDCEIYVTGKDGAVTVSLGENKYKISTFIKEKNYG